MDSNMIYTESYTGIINGEIQFFNDRDELQQIVPMHSLKTNFIRFLNSTLFNYGKADRTKTLDSNGNEIAGLTFNDTNNYNVSKISIGTGSVNNNIEVYSMSNKLLTTTQLTFSKAETFRNVYEDFTAITISRRFYNKVPYTLNISQVGLTRYFTASSYWVSAYDIVDPPVEFTTTTYKTVKYVLSFDKTIGQAVSCIIAWGANAAAGNYSCKDIGNVTVEPNAMYGSITCSAGTNSIGILLSSDDSPIYSSSYQIADIFSTDDMNYLSQDMPTSLYVHDNTASVIYTRSFNSLSESDLYIKSLGIYSNKFGTADRTMLFYRNNLSVPITLSQYQSIAVGITFSVY